MSNWVNALEHLVNAFGHIHQARQPHEAPPADDQRRGSRTQDHRSRRGSGFNGPSDPNDPSCCVKRRGPRR